MVFTPAPENFMGREGYEGGQEEEKEKRKREVERLNPDMYKLQLQ